MPNIGLQDLGVLQGMLRDDILLLETSKLLVLSVGDTLGVVVVILSLSESVAG